MQTKVFNNDKIGFLSPTQPFLINQKVDISILLGSILKEGFYKLVENYFISFDTVMIRSSFLKIRSYVW